MSQPGINSPQEDTSFEKLMLVASTFSIGAGSGTPLHPADQSNTDFFHQPMDLCFRSVGSLHQLVDATSSLTKAMKPMCLKRKKKGLIFSMVTSAVGIFTALTLNLKGFRQRNQRSHDRRDHRADVCRYGRFFLFEDGAVPQGG